ncbi:MAG: dihydroneopterin aldolase [Cyanobacteria bacterium]|jgi:dihydroneopterin aldolase|nr:dihydroneopterin aldolase [Cyanobacteria bacterium CG_2015-16_32_12]NCO76859.1 dihydroneopterin aldolase [Cyanobacteria bacterium CG_2015-22_32_23]NCQ03295.1 dihydroneopterin aldolase [Cyanobacteria bacterium CG_2015-09_32_10]NCQ42654.1 dihydroneopterin aldolase [Cyanobacteria bacterium CG_2015-04_32_10]NCS84346.1 dihydroneopterin aldolase [Cyanobacteria bacterium CG_2015-02_32_10]
MDSIKVTGIRGYGYTGLLPEERTLGQWFEVDLVLWVDLQPSGKSDNLDDTVDYRQAISIVKHLLKTAKFALVEKLADVIAEDVLKIKFINKVRVKLSKLSPPIPDFEGRITIDITRSL